MPCRSSVEAIANAVREDETSAMDDNTREAALTEALEDLQRARDA